MNTRSLPQIALSSALLLHATYATELSVPSVFSDGMVLQRETQAPLWGSADANQSVTITFGGQTYQTKANTEGKWEISLPGLKASAEGKPLQISAGESSITISDVLVGEVWVASGQSNMEWSMTQAQYTPKQTYDVPTIRQFSGRNVTSSTPQSNFKGQWKSAVGNDAHKFSAVAYHFAECLQEELNVPVGILELAWGGRPVQAFISNEAMTDLPEGQIYLQRLKGAVKRYETSLTPEGKAAFQKRLQKHEQVLADWEAGGKQGRKPHTPRPPVDPGTDASQPCTIYNGMINPHVGYGVRGAIWYQGESNSLDGQSMNYGELLTAMVQDWRQRWNQELPFYWVQIANFRAQSKTPDQDCGWTHIQDEQRRALATIPHSGMAVITDIGNANNVHPSNKKDVGERLARWALTKDYGVKGISYTGPLYKSTRFEGNKAIISFDYADGLTTMDGEPLRHFALAGEDGKWVWAQAQIVDDTVVVTSPSISKAHKVRYAWLHNAEGANLTNQSGLPTSCFSSEVE